MREDIVIGPPGTGKTTYGVRQIGRAVTAFGEAAVLVASFTRAAATEIAERATMLNAATANVGTLHSLCFRALGGDLKIADEKTDDFNDFTTEQGCPQFVLRGKYTPDAGDLAQGEGLTNDGQGLLLRMGVLRAKLVPPREWPEDVMAFASMWDDWKREGGLTDYTDLIERALYDLDYPPGGATVGFFDEVQDFKPLEMAVLRKWSRHMDHIVLIGDADQTLYEWSGASPRVFLDARDKAASVNVLAQSYRVPRAVHTVAQAMIRRVDDRIDADYRPRDVDGMVRQTSATARNPERLVPFLEKDIADGRSVMILASCSYLLAPTIALLRREGYPFANRWREMRGDWNPLAMRKGSLRAADRLLAFVRPRLDLFGDAARAWTVADAAAFVEPLSSAVLLRGVKRELERRAGIEGAASVEVGEVFDLVSLRPAATGDVDWYLSHLLPERRRQYEYAAAVLRRRGVAGLAADPPPPITVGTIHSVKGAEADCVYLFPDLSLQGGEKYAKQVGRDEVHRMFYVGMTRARERLVCASASSAGAVRW